MSELESNDSIKATPPSLVPTTRKEMTPTHVAGLTRSRKRATTQKNSTCTGRKRKSCDFAKVVDDDTKKRIKTRNDNDDDDKTKEDENTDRSTRCETCTIVNATVQDLEDTTAPSPKGENHQGSHQNSSTCSARDHVGSLIGMATENASCHAKRLPTKEASVTGESNFITTPGDISKRSQKGDEDPTTPFDVSLPQNNSGVETLPDLDEEAWEKAMAQLTETHNEQSKQAKDDCDKMGNGTELKDNVPTEIASQECARETTTDQKNNTDMFEHHDIQTEKEECDSRLDKKNISAKASDPEQVVEGLPQKRKCVDSHDAACTTKKIKKLEIQPKPLNCEETEAESKDDGAKNDSPGRVKSNDKKSLTKSNDNESLTKSNSMIENAFQSKSSGNEEKKQAFESTGAVQNDKILESMESKSGSVEEHKNHNRTASEPLRLDVDDKHATETVSKPVVDDGEGKAADDEEKKLDKVDDNTEVCEGEERTIDILSLGKRKRQSSQCEDYQPPNKMTKYEKNKSNAPLSQINAVGTRQKAPAPAPAPTRQLLTTLWDFFHRTLSDNDSEEDLKLAATCADDEKIGMSNLHLKRVSDNIPSPANVFGKKKGVIQVALPGTDELVETVTQESLTLDAPLVVDKSRLCNPSEGLSMENQNLVREQDEIRSSQPVVQTPAPTPLTASSKSDSHGIRKTGKEDTQLSYVASEEKEITIPSTESLQTPSSTAMPWYVNIFSSRTKKPRPVEEGTWLIETKVGRSAGTRQETTSDMDLGHAVAGHCNKLALFKETTTNVQEDKEQLPRGEGKVDKERVIMGKRAIVSATVLLLSVVTIRVLLNLPLANPPNSTMYNSRQRIRREKLAKGSRQQLKWQETMYPEIFLPVLQKEDQEESLLEGTYHFVVQDGIIKEEEEALTFDEVIESELDCTTESGISGNLKKESMQTFQLYRGSETKMQHLEELKTGMDVLQSISAEEPLHPSSALLEETPNWLPGPLSGPAQQQNPRKEEMTVPEVVLVTDYSQRSNTLQDDEVVGLPIPVLKSSQQQPNPLEGATETSMQLVASTEEQLKPKQRRLHKSELFEHDIEEGLVTHETKLSRNDGGELQEQDPAFSERLWQDPEYTVKDSWERALKESEMVGFSERAPVVVTERVHDQTLEDSWGQLLTKWSETCHYPVHVQTKAQNLENEWIKVLQDWEDAITSFEHVYNGTMAVLEASWARVFVQQRELLSSTSVSHCESLENPWRDELRKWEEERQQRKPTLRISPPQVAEIEKRQSLTNRRTKRWKLPSIGQFFQERKLANTKNHRLDNESDKSKRHGRTRKDVQRPQLATFRDKMNVMSHLRGIWDVWRRRFQNVWRCIRYGVCRIW